MGHPSQCRTVINPDGTVSIEIGTQDLGTGTRTIITQVAAETLGVPFETVRFEYGDTKLPQAPISAGSMTAASVGSAVLVASRALRDRLIRTAIVDSASPLHGLAPIEIRAEDGRLVATSGKSDSYVELIRRAGGKPIE